MSDEDKLAKWEQALDADTSPNCHATIVEWQLQLAQEERAYVDASMDVDEADGGALPSDSGSRRARAAHTVAPEPAARTDAANNGDAEMADGPPAGAETPRTIVVAPRPDAGPPVPEDAVVLLGVCLLVEFMLAPPEAAEPPQLRAFWADVGVLHAAPPLALPQLHDFVFRMFSLCMFTPECTVIALMLVIRVLSYHPHLRLTGRNCKRLLLCAMMVAQKYWDDTPLRNVDFATAWSRARRPRHPPRTRESGARSRPRPAQVQPEERPCGIDRINAMECIFLGALGFDLYVPEHKYAACVAELIAVVDMHRDDDARLGAMLDTHVTFLNGPAAKRFPWLPVNAERDRETKRANRHDGPRKYACH